MSHRSYHELMSLNGYAERLKYLLCYGDSFEKTFGPNRCFNQAFYRSPEWHRARRLAIVRDNGWDLGIDGLKITTKLCVHHINPITLDDILSGNPLLFDPENLICCSHETHNEIHYGSGKAQEEYTPRTPYDTCPWKRIEV